MTAAEIERPNEHQVIIVYTGQGGVPYINVVTRNPAFAASEYNRILIKLGKRLTKLEAEQWRSENPDFEDEVKELDGKYILAHTDNFDIYVEIVELHEEQTTPTR
jgi:hypothetical protein